MESALCLAVLAIVTAALPGIAVADLHYPSYKYPYEKYVPESLPIAQNDDSVHYALPEATPGDAACDRNFVQNENKVISEKFYKDHICLIKGDPPKDLTAFCEKFRKDTENPSENPSKKTPKKPPKIYQVMLLNLTDLGRLRHDLEEHKDDFIKDKELLVPTPSRVHYTTDDIYNFIYCDSSSGEWKGHQESNRYQQYVPKENLDKTYQIYHGCPPVSERHKFRLLGSCEAPCDRDSNKLDANDVISQTFYDAHICLIEGNKPQNIPAFCQTFIKNQKKNGPKELEVMLLNSTDLDRLREDLKGHQSVSFNSGALSSLDNTIGSTTNGFYDFIYCKKLENGGAWTGDMRDHRYLKYTPDGTIGNPTGPHNGCQLVMKRSGFRQLGSCEKPCHRHITLDANDVVSQEFYNVHICLIRRDPPKDLPAFCRDFRKSQPDYQVMLLTTKNLSRLRKDLQGHQNEFYNDRSALRPLFNGPGMIRYTTDDTYDFIYCEKSVDNGMWIGEIRRNLYLQYIPRGTEGNPKGLYKIYHGCLPVVTYPGFSLPAGYC